MIGQRKLNAREEILKDTKNSGTMVNLRNENFFDLMEIASANYRQDITQMIHSIQCEDVNRFIQSIGNKSLKSGLEI